MENLNKLKKALLFVEKSANLLEQGGDIFPENREDLELAAEYMRTAAACMWEKLEHLEAEEAENGKENG